MTDTALSEPADNSTVPEAASGANNGTAVHRLSVMYPSQPDTLGPAVDFARFARETGFTRLWFGQSLRLEAHLTMAALASAVPGLPLGTSIALAPLRHPYQAAVEARTLAHLSGAEYVAGYGPGGVEFQQSFLGGAVPKPLRLMGEYLGVVRSLLDGQVVRHHGEDYTLTARLPTLTAPSAEVGLGVLRPGMARTAGRCADVAITWLTPPWYVAEHLVPACTEGAAKTGRQAPRIAVVVHAAVDRHGRDPVQAAHTAVGAHLSTPHYTDMLQRAGVEAHPSTPQAGVKALVSNGVFLTGRPESIAQELQQYRKSGVDEVILNLSGIHFTEGEAAARRDLGDIAAAGGLQ